MRWPINALLAACLVASAGIVLLVLGYALDLLTRM